MGSNIKIDIRQNGFPLIIAIAIDRTRVCAHLFKFRGHKLMNFSSGSTRLSHLS